VRYLLDTCVFLWLCAEPGRLSPRARGALGEAAADYVLSEVSLLEISLKWAAGKVSLPQPPRAWIEEQARIWRTSPRALTRSVIYRSTELPAVHRDPFDRLLIATALEDGATVVTPDPLLHKYPVPCLW
jgi:PIN domain nuclease of toxin-antitoxin system